MAEAQTISRKKDQNDNLDFDRLRREGIQYVQQLSGKLWTDFNIHDPGVTILDQLCFALTDLLYRCDFNVEDVLCGEDGRIDMEALALYEPHDVFPCRPTTVDDIRKAILDAFGDLDNVWVHPLTVTEQEGNGYSGLYRIIIRTIEKLGQEQQQDIIDAVSHAYVQKRNLCEDVQDVIVVEETTCRLHAEIEVNSSRHPTDILADIYYRCANHIAGGVGLYPYAEEYTQGKPLDEILTGPLTQHGIFKDIELENRSGTIAIDEFFSLINMIEGVSHIKTLCIEIEGDLYYDNLEMRPLDGVLRLEIPDTKNDIRVVLVDTSRELSVPVRGLTVKLDELRFKYRSLRHSWQDIHQIYSPPRGKYGNLSQYSSIQNQFPLAYGINAYGIPESESPDVKGRVAQLKAYLLLFEQVMSNSLANLGGLRHLFSLSNNRSRTYLHQVLSGEEIPGVDAIYPENPDQVLTDILNDFDDISDRNSRLLDYVLALYGESFTQNSLRNFNYYYSSQEIEEVIVRNKLEYLKSVVLLNRNRAAAPDYYREMWDSENVSGLHAKACRLLGFRHCHCRSLIESIQAHNLKLVSHSQFKRQREETTGLEFFTPPETVEWMEDVFESVLHTDLPSNVAIEQLRQDIDTILPFESELFSDELLRGGISIDRYKIARPGPEDEFQLLFECLQEQQWWCLSRYQDIEQAVVAANNLRCFLIHLNSGSEGMHIVEHILLRPVGKDVHEGIDLPINYDFYSFRISVILPAWTARCHDLRFRNLAEETVRLNCPAHIYPNFYWLDFAEMHEFEGIYDQWLRIKQDRDVGMDKCNEAAKRLVHFLLHGGNLIATTNNV